MENRILSEGIEIDDDNSNSGDNIGTAKADKKDDQALTLEKVPTTQFIPGKEFSDSKSNVRFRVPFVLVKMDLTVDHKKNRLNSTKKSQINDGRKTEKRVQQFKCTVCGLKFQSSSVLQGHSKIHLEKRNDALTRELADIPPPEFAVPSKSLDWKLRTNVRPIVELTKLDLSQIAIRVVQKKSSAHASNSKQNLNLTKTQLVHGSKIGKQHKCTICEKKFKYLSYLKTHLISHSDDRSLFKCQTSSKPFKHKRHLEFHSKIHSDEKPTFECHECGNLFYRLSDLRRHNPNRNDQKQFRCDKCKKEFRTKPCLTYHLWNHHGKGDYKDKKCPACNKNFSANTCLAKHYRLHSGERPFECSMCDRRFIDNYTLNNHILTHTGEKPFVCHICRKSYRSWHSLKYHSRLHKQ